MAGGRYEITADVSEEFSNKVKETDTHVSWKNGRLIVDMPDSINPNSIIEGILAAKGSVLSVIPRRKRLEDLFVETVRSVQA